MNLANKLTLFRVALVPFFLLFMALDIPYSKVIATSIFIIASITDQLDGYVARSRNQITDFGKFMDPLADKLLVISALISLVELHMIGAWVVVVIISREFAVSGLRTLAASDGTVIAASVWGKLKTVIQMITIIWLLIFMKQNNNVIYNVSQVLIYSSVIITIISGIDYFVKNNTAINTNKWLKHELMSKIKLLNMFDYSLII